MHVFQEEAGGEGGSKGHVSCAVWSKTVHVVDMLALNPGVPTLAVLATTGSNHAARREKLAAEGFIALWKGAGAVLEIWSWDKQGPRGERKAWTLRWESL